MTSSAYRRLRSIWAADGVVVLDGGVGSELERIGFPRNRNVGDLWGTVALYEAPDLAREVGSRYVRAGADVITTHTWRIDGIPAAERAGLVDPTGGGWREKSRLAVELAREAIAREARDAPPAVAFSVWTEPAETAFLEDLAEAIVDAEPDLILAETTETIADAEEALQWRDVEGARIIGGCCGTTPEHIAAVVAVLA
ncbi:MAG: homocysteine S-methyltransferase family protein [Thermoleophilia bacterium]|nr:homocysteine S-methyltransferase family protein [Thermoleophilia bacterium]